MIDAVFFDFDGVLADSVDVKTRAFCALYAPHGEDVVASVRAYHLAHGGISRFEKFRHWQRNLVCGQDDEATINDLADRFAAEVKKQVTMAPEIAGAGAALQALHGRCTLFIVSGTPEEELVDIVKDRGLARFFSAIRGAPARKEVILRDLMRGHGLAASRCVMVGDAMTDHDAALSVGMPFVGIAADGCGPFPPGTRVFPDLTPIPACLAISPAPQEAVA
jgi:phosphoglycolate phosphatase-like HAD superfamily hydrolase